MEKKGKRATGEGWPGDRAWGIVGKGSGGRPQLSCRQGEFQGLRAVPWVTYRLTVGI